MIVLAACLFLFVIALLYRQRKKKFGIFKKLGVQGPQPNMIFGNLREFYADSVHVLQKWNKQYSKDRMFGMYIGDVPTLVSTDLCLMSKVLIKEHFNFPNKGELMMLEAIHPVLTNMISVQTATAWKKTRNYVTPSFSTSKLRAMVPLMEKGCLDLERHLEKMVKKNDEIDMISTWKCFVLDNITRVSFGVQSSSLENPKNTSPMLEASVKFMDGLFISWKNVFVQLFTDYLGVLRNLGLVLYKLGLFSHSCDDLHKLIQKIIILRKQTKDLSHDFISSLLAAEEINDVSITKISSNTVAANAIIFLAAGVETTSTSLGFLTNVLAEHQSIQDKLRNEIQCAVKANGGNIDYDLVQSIRYLSQVIDENLRINPPATAFTTRQALKDFEFKGKWYPKGISIMFPTREIHHDPEYFPDPERFNPDRFSAERRSEIPSMAFQPFGDGPRNCIGMRIALTQMKLAVCYILMRYRILPTTTKSKVLSHGPVLSVPSSVRVRLETL